MVWSRKIRTPAKLRAADGTAVAGGALTTMRPQSLLAIHMSRLQSLRLIRRHGLVSGMTGWLEQRSCRVRDIQNDLFQRVYIPFSNFLNCIPVQSVGP